MGKTKSGKNYSMELNKFVSEAKKTYNISDFDMSYVIEKITGKTRTMQIFDNTISNKEIADCTQILKRYLNGEPLNKIFNEQNFFGFNFYINNNVLAPRPETEILVDNALKMIKDNQSVLDLCCGSGIIGLTIKKLRSDVAVTLSDISSDALKVCRQNAEKLNVDVNILQSDLFENITGKFDFILSNPPYIKLGDKDTLDKGVLLYDPHIALFGGDDGMLFYNRIMEQVNDFLLPGGKIIFEIGYDIKRSIENLATANNYDITFIKDYNNIDRVAILKRK